ncbi:metallophosphoesterase [Siphonobacter sp.]|uniref:metallophosphoesterase n=1 Tax=Siphonobacter sp. TaxID=1869184 RepID=UPI003B3B7B79
MQVLAIGDLHGRLNWEEAPIQQADRVIFVGDYVDSKQFSDEQTTEVLQKVIALKRAEPEKYILLLGNHDVAYLHYPLFPCSNFRPKMQALWTGIYRENADCFQVAYQLENYLFTHAGVSSSWAQKHGNRGSDLADRLNALQETPAGREVVFQCGWVRGGNPGAKGGPVWADETETIDDYLPDWHQVVGHTPQPFIRTQGDETASITYIDVLGKQTDFWQRTFV